MVNKNYAKGYAFERRVKKALEEKGWMVIRQGKSAFPDIIALKKGETMIGECKVSKYISAQERKDLINMRPYVDNVYVIWREQNKEDKRKTDIVFGMVEDYEECFRI